MTQSEPKLGKPNRLWLKSVAGSVLLLAIVFGGSVLYFAALEPERSEEHRIEYERVADQLYSDPLQARRNFELIASRPAGAPLGDLDLSAGVWQPFVPMYEQSLPGGNVDLSALSRVYWEPALDRLRVAMVEGDDADLQSAVGEVFARMRCMRDIGPDAKALSWTAPIDRLRDETLELVENEQDITPDRLESLAEAFEAVPELPDFEIFLDLAMLTFEDLVSNHFSSGGWFIPSTAPGVAASHYGTRDWPVQAEWLDIAAITMPRASECLALAEECFEPVYELHRNGVLLADFDQGALSGRFTAPIDNDFNAFVSIALPAMSRQYEAWLQARAARVYLPIELRVIAYQRRAGEWPTMIEQVTDGEPPIDPATSQPISLTPSQNEADPPRVGWADLLP